MPASRQSLVVVDTCVLIAILAGDRPGDEELKYDASLAELRRMDSNPHVMIGLPSLVAVELMGTRGAADGGATRADRKARRARASDWLGSSTFTPIDLDPSVAELAAELAFDHQLKGADAVIAASAVHHEAQVLLTWDKAILRFGREHSGKLVVRRPNGENTQTALNLDDARE